MLNDIDLRMAALHAKMAAHEAQTAEQIKEVKVNLQSLSKRKVCSRWKRVTYIASISPGHTLLLLGTRPCPEVPCSRTEWRGASIKR